MKRRSVILVVVLLCTLIARAQYQQVNDIRYTESTDPYAQERCKLDVYYPTNQQDAPVVVWFHGGGIEGGNKHIDPQLKNSGLVVVAANYRLLPNASIDEILDDAAAAVAWTYKNITKYGGSKRKIFVAGHSAGGYLLDMIGLDKRWLAKYGVDADSLAALVPFSGQCITHYNIRKQRGISPLQATIDEYAPLTYVRPDAPPIVIISGDRELELYGRYEEQAYFWRMLKLVGHKDVTLYEMQGYDHGSMPQPAYSILKQHIRRLTEGPGAAQTQSSLSVSAQETYCFAERDTCSLYLDIFRPVTSTGSGQAASTGSGQAASTGSGQAKPAILFVFGGGFTSGRRSDDGVRGWFRQLNANGYTVVAIDYRLGMKGFQMGKGLRGAKKALNRFLLSQQIGVEDVCSAVAFLAAHPELNVPADNIVISGSSAGAIIALASAHAVANGQTDGLPEGFNFKGVMSFAGAIISKTGAPKFPKVTCPILLFHGTADRVVAYEHFGLPRQGIWGSSYIAKQLKDDGFNYNIWRFQGLGHEVASYMDVMWKVEKDFLEKNVMQGIPCKTDAIVDDPSLPRWNSWKKKKTADLYK